ncbi:type II toxin-antitoxin system prevent-host-death family antitoxin [Candidatus Gracilibacteria bacterium]|nr:type II toxin-antitoxin system prevent-host-death family antitoxin [Candidatus Gracilibacteria bacterium]
MNAVTVKDAKNNLEQLIEQVIADAEPTIVVSENGQRVVFLSLDEYNSWKETLYLLSNPANAARLRASIVEAEAGQVHEQELDDRGESFLHCLLGKIIFGFRSTTENFSSASTS